MPDIVNFVDTVEELSHPALTVRAQAVSPDDNGQLVYPIFFPRENVNSVKIKDITIRTFRPAASRREWNGPGRLMPILTPDHRDLEMIPIEFYSALDEREMQTLEETTDGEELLILRRLGATIPERVENLAAGVYRRLELEFPEVWTSGQITQDDPQTGRTVVTDFEIDSGRLQTAPTAWNDGSVNAYNEMMAWIRDGISEIGPVEGVVLRLATVLAIEADAPTLLNGYRPTRAEIARRITDEIGFPFEFIVMERTVDKLNDGGTAYTKTKTWPAEQVSLVPAGGVVGGTAFAPVARAGDLVRQVPEAGIDRRGVTIYFDKSNDGKHLKIMAQANALPVPDESLVWSIDAGV